MTIPAIAMAVPIAIGVTAIRGEVKVVDIVGQVVFLAEAFQLLFAGKLDPTGAVDVHVPPPRLLAMLPLLQPPRPALGQGLVNLLEFLGQVGGPAPNFD